MISADKIVVHDGKPYRIEYDPKSLGYTEIELAVEDLVGIMKENERQVTAKMADATSRAILSEAEHKAFCAGLERGIKIMELMRGE